jgi:hypothetical protein
MLRTNLGCFGMGFFEVLMVSPFVTNTVEPGSLFVWPVAKDADL